MENTNKFSNKEAKLRVTYLKNMQQRCYKLCGTNNTNPELNYGEKSCIDRCVGKYLEAAEYVGKLYQEEQINKK